MFWSHVRGKLKTKSGVAPLLEDVTDKNSTKFDDQEKANILQRQFASVFTNEPPGMLPHFDKKTNATITDQITEEIVKREIRNLNIDKACGPDDIHPQMLVELNDFISAPLAMLFNKTISTGTIPDDWRMAFVTAIYKKGPQNRPENYRPISLTSIICKIMEKLLKEAIMKHVLENNLLSKYQHGFIPGRSTTTQLLSFLDKCAEIVSVGGIVETIYFDFAKAFDTVPHKRLLKKLESYGIKGNILKWIKTFLTNRTQIVKVNGKESVAEAVMSGVPQGSVLGPILFIIYINDLPESVQSDVFLFADDTKILRQVENQEDAKHLQDDITALEEWSAKWLLQFHPDKCQVLSISKHQNTKQKHKYVLHHHELNHVSKQKDLGLTVDRRLKFTEHIAAKVKTANSMMGLIRRSFSFLDSTLFLKLYPAFVRPYLEYAQVAWSPFLKKDINMVENVQRRATKLIDDFQNYTYSERLAKLNLPTLMYRRMCADMCEIYKHLHTYDKTITKNGFKMRHRPSRKHNFQLERRTAEDGVRGYQSNSFYFRSVKIWNELPETVVEACNINVFKRRIDQAWSNKKFDLQMTYQS